VRFVIAVDRADELGRGAERRVVQVYDDAGDHRDGVLVIDKVLELHLEYVADLTLGFGVEDVERIGRGTFVGVAHQCEQANLRAVAVRDDQPVAQRGSAENPRRIARRVRLAGGLERLATAKQRVASQRHDCRGISTFG
jgi:hypothetical protein